MILDEILDKPLPWKLMFSGSEEWQASIKLDSASEIRFTAHTEKEDGPWFISFSENWEDEGKELSTYDKTGRGREFSIFASLKEVIFAFLKAKNPAVIKYEADKVDHSRASVYKRLFIKHLPGYKLTNDDEGQRYYDVFTLTRKDLNEVLDKPLKRHRLV